MNMQKRMSGMVWLLVLGMTGSLWAQDASTQAATASDGKISPANPKVGVVTGNNVYVRSGANQNYYPVTKLDRGQKVTVVGKEFGWVKIVPPEGCFSLVDKTYVDRVDDNTGVLNGNVYVRTGSKLSDRIYVRQVKLGKGSKVRIIGETENASHYKIVPPPGAYVWMHGDFVKLTGEKGSVDQERKAPALEPVEAEELDLSGTEEQASTQKSTTRPATGGEDKPEPKHGAPEVQTSDYQLKINAIEAEITTEFNKPLKDRQFGPIIDKLKPMAEQEKDRLAQAYAKTRIQQMETQMEMAAAVQEMQELRNQAITEANKHAREREKIKARMAVKPEEIVVKGRITISGIYDNRWRVIDPETNRTLAYIEVAKGSGVDPVDYYGKPVGIKAVDRRLLKGTVQPIPIYTVSEIVELEEMQAPKPASPQPNVSVSTVSSSTKPAASTQPAGAE